jgi:uncharacterized membrane-anchored protein
MKRLKFGAIVLLQVLLLTGMIGYRQHWVDTGEKILLRTVPVDPRDLFRGDYVRLTYEISNLDLDALSVYRKFKPNTVVYVGLEREPDGVYKAVSAAETPPPGKKFIQGRARYEQTVSKWEVTALDDAGGHRVVRPRWFGGFKNGEHVLFCMDNRGNVLQQMKEMPKYVPKCPVGSPLWTTVETVKERKARQLNIEYGIESYFVEEGSGHAIEMARNAGEVKVQVSLRNDGKGIITGLFVDGRQIR